LEIDLELVEAEREKAENGKEGRHQEKGREQKGLKVLRTVVPQHCFSQLYLVQQAVLVFEVLPSFERISCTK
jgi:hypothetical protein